MELKRKQPIGIELVRRGLVTEDDIAKALAYQKGHPGKKIGDIINILGLCEPQVLINAIAEILDEKGMILTSDDVIINLTEYISIDIAKKNKAVPFEISSGKVKVCFASTANKRAVETIRLMFLNKGLVIDKYITFEDNIDNILKGFEGASMDNIEDTGDVTELVDTIIKTAMDKRASDIHIEPLEKEIRVRYRIDGELLTEVKIAKDKQNQIIGRLKAISNMHQEKQESQDGRILNYSEYNIRVSSQKNIYGEKFVLRLLKKNTNVQKITELGFPDDDELFKKSFHKKNSIVIVAAPTGEGKTTSLYSIINGLNDPSLNITTIEDPVEIRIPGLNQIEIDSKTNFSGSLRTVLRQDPDIILVGEIRDKETAEIAMQAGQTGHYVLSTIHTIDSIEVITRLRKMGLTNYDIASTVATCVSQRLVRKVCPHCAQEREFDEQEIGIMKKIGERYNYTFDFDGKKTFDTIGCKKCNNTGYYGRIGIFEILLIEDELKDLISEGASSIKIKQEALNGTYRPLVIDGINKILAGHTTLEELNKKLVLY